MYDEKSDVVRVSSFFDGQNSEQWKVDVNDW